MMASGYYNDEKELLKIFLKTILFNKESNASYMSSLPFNEIEAKREEMASPRKRLDYTSIEFIVRPECNLSCEYCYLRQYGKDSYPIEERVSKEKTLSNLRAALDYIYKKNGLYIHTYDLFSGDLFYDGFVFDILDIFYEYMSHEHEMYRNLYTQKTNFPVSIQIPTNPTFILDNDKTIKIDQYIEKFWDIGVRIYLSISTDGYYCIDTRERAQYPDEYWDKLFKFCYKHEYFFHPMVGADNIENWIENYDWWKEKITEYDFEPKMGPGHFLPMMLEVRNDNWTPEKIGSYIRFLNYMIDDRFAMCNYNLEDFTRHIMKNGEQSSLHPLNGGYDPILLINEDEKQNLLCGLQTTIHIRLNDLTIVPCHRTTYKQFEAGQFVLDPTTNKIVDVEPKNVCMWLQIMNIRRNTLPRCAKCVIQPYCISGCLGAQYESSGEIFCPIDSVCLLFLNKVTFLIHKYEKMGVFEMAKKIGCLPPKREQYINNIKSIELYERFRNE